jgi:hypothetical protein
MREPIYAMMKKILLLTTALVSLGLAPAFAQMGRAGGPNFGGAMDKLFGANQSFSARISFESIGADSNTMTMPGKMSFDTGKSRFEMNMSEMQSSQMPAGASVQLKAMGMDRVISISRPDLKLGYLVYPGLNSYAEMASQDPSVATNQDDYKVENTEVGKETVDGHDCVKNQVVVTDKAGNTHNYQVWRAGDLNEFPVKIVTNEGGSAVTIEFKEISLTKPAASLFEAPSGYTKYDNAQTMMQTEMMKRMGGGAGAPPAQN